MIAIKIGLIICLMLFLWLERSLAQEIAVPIDIQYPLFLKILTFDRNLKARVGAEIVIGVVYQKKFRVSFLTCEEFVTAINTSPIKKIEKLPVKYVLIDLDSTEISTALSNNAVDMLYVTPLRAVEIKQIVGICHDRHLTTLTGVVDYVEQGLGIGIGIKDKKPKIIINLPASKAEGLDFSSELLKLAKIIQ